MASKARRTVSQSSVGEPTKASAPTVSNTVFKAITHLVFGTFSMRHFSAQPDNRSDVAPSPLARGKRLARAPRTCIKVMSERSGELFWMPGDAKNPISIAVDLEIEAVMVVDAGLPYILGFVILLGPERGVLEV